MMSNDLIGKLFNFFNTSSSVFSEQTENKFNHFPKNAHQKGFPPLISFTNFVKKQNNRRRVAPSDFNHKVTLTDLKKECLENQRKLKNNIDAQQVLDDLLQALGKSINVSDNRSAGIPIIEIEKRMMALDKSCLEEFQPLLKFSETGLAEQYLETQCSEKLNQPNRRSQIKIEALRHYLTTENGEPIRIYLAIQQFKELTSKDLRTITLNSPSLKARFQELTRKQIEQAKKKHEASCQRLIYEYKQQQKPLNNGEFQREIKALYKNYEKIAEHLAARLR